MIDFAKLAQANAGSTPSTIIETFQRLDRQVSHVELRPSQIKTLKALSQRIDERDIVVKLNTGGGKTTIGLLYLKHLMDKHREPAVYLVPNTQLAQQVLSEGSNIGLPVYQWKSRQSYPPEEALRCEGVIVCTYDKFFNGRSTFARQRLTPCAVVLDDVHAGIESIRAQFSSRLPASTLETILSLLANVLQEHDPVTWAGIRRGAADAIMEVPFWIQAEYQVAITQLLTDASESEELKFSWPNIAPSVDRIRIFLSGTEGFITSDPPNLDRISHYVGAKHRLFMSASVHDGAVLVRELGCSKQAAITPVDESGESSVGERMVIVPSLIDTEFSDSELIEVAIAVSRSANVVVLVPSFSNAKKWQDIGARVASPDDIADVISALRNSVSGNIVVFAQRYDGVDLPDNACRLLIIDGLPVAENLADKQESSRTSSIAGMRGKTAIKIEQGMGRAVRSSSDYCAVILAGRDVAGFISRSKVAKNLSPYTAKQLEIGRNVSAALRGTNNVKQGIIDTVLQILRRDAGWKLYYQQEIAKAVVSDDLKEEIKRRVECSGLERDASKSAQSRDYNGAVREMQKACDLIGDLDIRGVAKQVTASYQYFYDREGAMRMQVSAYGDNPQVCRPPMLMPAHIRKITNQAESICAWLKSFTDPNGPIIELGRIKANLSFGGGHKIVEQAVKDLGSVLGAESSRPDKEFGRGPDNLWIFGEEAYVIEVKSEKSSNLSKADAEQLQSSLLWVEQNYPGISVRNAILVSDVHKADVLYDFAFGARVWSQDDLNSIVDGVRYLSTAAVSQGELFLSSAANIQGMLSGHEILPGQLRTLGRKPAQS